MRTLHSAAAAVSWSRIVRDHRKALVPLGVVLAINVALLLALVLPLSRRVASNEDRARAAERAEETAAAEFQQAEAVRAGKTRATEDLEMFYRQVLPADIAAARRVVQSKVQRMAASHDVAHSRGTTNTEEIRGSSLERLTTSLTLSGDYDDIRALIYEIETGPDFIVIDNLVLAEGFEPNSLALTLELSTYYRVASAATAGSSGQAGTNGR